MYQAKQNEKVFFLKSFSPNLQRLWKIRGKLSLNTNRRGKRLSNDPWSDQKPFRKATTPGGTQLLWSSKFLERGQSLFLFRKKKSKKSQKRGLLKTSKWCVSPFEDPRADPDPTRGLRTRSPTRSTHRPLTASLAVDRVDLISAVRSNYFWQFLLTFIFSYF